MPKLIIPKLLETLRNFKFPKFQLKTYSSLPLKSQILSGFILVSSLTLISGGLATYFSQNIIMQYRKIAVKVFPSSLLATNLRGLVKEIRGSALRLGLTDLSPQEIQQIISKMKSQIDQYADIEGEFLIVDPEAGLTQEFAATKLAWDSVKRSFMEIIATFPEGKPVVREKYYELIRGTFKESVAEFTLKINELITDQQSKARKSRELAESAERAGNRWNAIILILSVILSLFVGVSVANHIIALLNGFASSLSKESEALYSSSDSLNKNGQQLASAVQEQAAAVAETVASTEEMRSMLEQTSANSIEGLKITRSGIESSAAGRKNIQSMRSAMDEIEEQTEQLEKLSLLILNIQKSTAVINTIVSETRLLSFNASIESARAGVHGRSFSVVAEEVGKLATLSGREAEGINKLIESSVKKFTQVIAETKSRVSKGRNIVMLCDDSLEEINSALEKIGESVNGISSATREQEIGITQTNTAMLEMDKMTHMNSQSSEQLSAEALALTSSSERIKNATQRLLDVVRGNSSV